MPSTNSGQLLSGQHINDPGSADFSFHHHPAWRIGNHLSNDARILSEFIFFYCRKDIFSVIRCDKGKL